MNDENKRLINLGSNIKAERSRKRISQEVLAERICTSRNTISSIEMGNKQLKALKLIDIARVLEVDINILLKDV